MLCFVAQLCLTLCDPMNYSPSCSSVQGFSRQEYCSGLPCPPPGDLPNSGIEPRSPALQEDSLPSKPPGLGFTYCVCVCVYIYTHIHIYIYIYGASWVELVVKNPPGNAGDRRCAGWIPGLGRSPGGGHTTHSSILAWKTPWTEEPGGLQSIVSQRVEHD